MKVINLATIKALNPCKDRRENYIKFYKNREFTPKQFMGLKHITHKDKVWVAFRLMPKDNIKLAAADIAESVLHLYENKFPNDLRPRKAIEAARTGTKEEALTAAYAAYASYADSAVNTAAYAAYAAYAAATASAYAAEDLYFTASNKQRGQKKLIRTIILKYWK